MKSPFPGMDPYLESHWGDVHTSAMVYARNQINAQLPDGLQARVEEGLSIKEDDELLRNVYPDVRIIEESNAPAGVPEAEVAATALADPDIVIFEDEPRTWRNIEIVDRRADGRVVTVIELLSPANKIGLRGQMDYLQKQSELLAAGVNLVEIDLIRTGNYVLSFPQDRLPSACETIYLACVRRTAWRNRAALYSMPLRKPLRHIPVPLRSRDRDVILRLQELIDDCYRDGRYDHTDYRVEPEPRLNQADAAWADALLREKGLR